ncbi:MAG: hypothetical protein VX871_08035 [Pseudomonadota bacterium]|nr:hypothetical protein [Pseudomonadota bacterium]
MPLAAILAAALGLTVTPAPAQDQPNPAPIAPVYAPSMALDPDAQRRADQIRREQYKSETIGQGGNLSLDVGKFVTDTNPVERSLPDVQEESYTGMRLRLPLKGGQQ